MISRRQKVLILWGFVLGVFAAFNAVYWPVARYQAAVDPAHFVDRALALYAVGETSEAIAQMQRGIAAYRPPYPEPYRLLARWHTAHGEHPRAAPLEPRYQFYRAWTARHPEERARFLQEAVLDSLALEPLPEPPARTAQAAREMAVRISALFNTADAVEQWTPQEQLALLRLSGGALQHDGLIGATEIAAPADMLALSGGGEGPRRMAQLFAGGRSYASSRRGFHVMLLEPESGNVLHLMVFDIWAAPEEAQRMAEFLEAAPEGAIGLFAVLDDASAHLSPRLEQALLAFGLRPEAELNRMPVLLGPRFSFAAIGIKGAPEGSAVQAWSPDNFMGYPGHPVAAGVLAQGEEQP